MPGNITPQEGYVTRKERESHQGYPAATFWLTGLSGSGKSTVALAFERHLFGTKNAFVLDGDNVRHGLNKDLGFSSTDRRENIRRIAEIARIFNDFGQIIICAFISPYRVDRKMAREIIGSESFIEVYLSTPLETCENRDPKGLYKKARIGEIPNFTGVSAPYEEPWNPDVVLDTSILSVRDCVKRLVDHYEIVIV